MLQEEYDIWRFCFVKLERFSLVAFFAKICPFRIKYKYMFQKVDTRKALPDMELGVLKFWQENRIFEKSVEQRLGREKYVFFDGPPFANGLPHYGHILAGVLKDAVTRYWTMKGFYVPRTNGWDCHGLPVEYEIEKDLGLSGRKEIVEYGVENFNEKCKESVFRYTEQWEELMKRVGRWVDFGDSYATLENNYMESIWWVFKSIWDKEMIYSGFKSMHICPRCETALSNFEVSQGYKDVTDLSATVKFKLKEDALSAISAEGDVYVLAWTTTPWTLPGNTALAFGSEIDYVKFGIKDWPGFPDGTYVASRVYYEKNFDVLPKVEAGGKMPSAMVLDAVSSKRLVGTHYEPLFDYYVGKDLEGEAYSIQVADFVTTDDGTGVVHIAPMFGEDDYSVAQANGLAKIQHVSMDGTFKEEVKDFVGKFVKGQDMNVANFLEEKGLLFKKENYRHSYPHCWRCDTPLLNYSTRSLFVKVTDIKERLLENNKKINWQPSHIQEGRFGKWLDSVRDWSISRNRFWGCAIPVWECECGNQECLGSIEELKARSVGGKLPLDKKGELDLHKPYIDEIKINCGKCSAEMTRIPDVLDCWFESGAMPYAQLHYPFENKEEFEKNFPANFIAEGLDQTRGWFYTLHVLSTILFDEPAFKNIIVNGILLAADGEKLSKRKKNYPDPNELFNSKGVDSTRYFLLSSTAALAEDVRFSELHVDEVVKKFTLTIWNTYSFFVTYALIDEFEPLPEGAAFRPSNKLDLWLLSELHQLIKTVTENMDNYNLSRATRPMLEFVENLSNWYIRRSRRRFWKSENDGDKNEAYQTLYIVLVELSKLNAPFMPFLSDEIYRNLTQKESVHLEDWPVCDESYIDEALNTEIHLVRLVVNLGHAVRSKAKIKVRQPLLEVRIGLPKNISSSVLELHREVIQEELNVKSMDFIEEAGDVVEHYVNVNAKILGPKYGKEVQTIIGKVKEGDYQVLEDGTVKVLDYILTGEEIEIGFKGKDGYDVQSEEGVVVMLDTRITDELKREGLARDVVRQIQEMRKEADYQVDDRIYVAIHCEGELEQAVTDFASYIRTETLAEELRMSTDMDGDLEKEFDVEGMKARIVISKK